MRIVGPVRNLTLRSVWCRRSVLSVSQPLAVGATEHETVGDHLGTALPGRFIPCSSGCGPIQGAQDGLYRRQFDVGVNAGSPAGASVSILDLNVGDGRGFLTGAKSVFAVLFDLKARHAGAGKTMNERRQGSVAFSRQFDGLAVAEQARMTAHDADATLCLEIGRASGREEAH